jgi:hypothetical protein
MIWISLRLCALASLRENLNGQAVSVIPWLRLDRESIEVLNAERLFYGGYRAPLAPLHY